MVKGLYMSTYNEVTSNIIYNVDYLEYDDYITSDIVACSLKLNNEYILDENRLNNLELVVEPTVSWGLFTLNSENDGDFYFMRIDYVVSENSSESDRSCKLYLKYKDNQTSNYITFNLKGYNLNLYKLYWVIFVDISMVPTNYYIGLWRYINTDYTPDLYLTNNNFMSNGYGSFNDKYTETVGIVSLSYVFEDIKVTASTVSKISGINLGSSHIIHSQDCMFERIDTTDPYYNEILKQYLNLPDDLHSSNKYLWLYNLDNWTLSYSPGDDTDEMYSLWTTVPDEQNVYNYINIKILNLQFSI